jgi:RHS repeat-associated protein
MQSTDANFGYGTASDFYSSNNSVNYPAVELKQAPTYRLVSQLKNTAMGVTRFQQFRYNGYIVRIDGIGSIGFKKTSRTAWYNSDTDKKTWAVTEIDPLLRGATKLTFTLLPSTANFSFPTNLTTGLMNKTENSFPTPAAGVFPYTILLQNQKYTDYVTGIVNETIYNTYDSYNLPTSVTKKNYVGTTLQGTTLTETEYDTPSFGTGSNYYIGRPKKIITTATAYGSTKKSSQTISYLNGNVSQIDKNVYQPNGVTLDPVTMVEKMTYFPNGLLKDKEISATGTTAGVNDVTPRKVAYTYDPTNRFVSTTTDPELLVSTNMSFHPLYGSVLVAKNPFNQTITNVYDNWGKQTSVTDNTLNLVTKYAYTRTNNIYTTTVTKTTTGNIGDGSSSIVEQDALAREIRQGSKNLSGTWTYVVTEYDTYGRKSRTSEPYIEGSSASQWTVYQYDDFSRPTRTTSFTGKVVNTAYSGLIVTVADSVMSKSKTIDSNGQTTTTTDSPGGIINYTYDANGNLLESNYEGIKTTIAYDNWGRKTQLADSYTGTYPTTGIYKYTYNAYGEVKTEVAPKGTTTYTYHGLSGRLLTKSIQGLTTADATNIVSTYNYNATTKLLDSMTVTNPNDGGSTFAYTYDAQRRLFKTVETQTLQPSGTAVFTKQLAFDLFSRVDTETNTATAFGKTSTKAIKHIYSSNNGAEFQIKDNTTLANLWQANAADARGNITTATLGNGIAVSNTFDSFGYASQFQHKLGTATIMTLNTTFEPILGNLSSRYNSMFDHQEKFTYDALDRLTSWDGLATNLLTLPFNTTTEGFTFSGTNTQGSVTNVTGKLRINLQNVLVNATKNLNITAVPGDKLRIRCDISSLTVSNSTIARLLLVETDAEDDFNFIEFPFLTVSNGIVDLNYTVSDNFQSAKLSLKIILEGGSNCTTCPGIGIDGGTTTLTANATFFLDNLKIDKIAVNSQSYDNKGRITNNNLGDYQYDTARPYQNSRIVMTPFALQYYTGRPQQEATYNAFKAPVRILEQGIDLIKFGYNAFEQRSAMYYGNTSEDKLSKPFRRYYSADGSMEITATFAAGNNATPVAVELLTYIGGSAYTAPVVLKSNGTTQNYFYLHRDYQGTILAITNASGAVVEKRLFDAWGAVLKVQDGAGNNLTKLTFFDRGYTGHEHLQSVGLINMNARLYDPMLHRFLSVDNYVQDPSNTQNYNRYGYCVNNPLKYTDITGNVFNIATLVGCIPVIGSIFASLLMHQSIDWGRVAVDAVVFAISAAVTAGIGDAVNGITNFYTKAAVSALAHGTFQGGLSAAQGGKFWAGFAAGALSSIASSAWQGGTDTVRNTVTGKMDPVFGTGMKGIGGQFANTVGGTLAFSAVMGGAGSAIGGGNFWQGATTGLIVAGFNHLKHQIDPPGNKRDPLVRADGSRITNADVNGDGKVTLIELEYWYRNGGGTAINIKASSLSMEGVDPNLFKGLPIGTHVGVNLLFSDFWGGEGALYGELEFIYQGGNKVSIVPNMYNFDVGADVGHPWFNSWSGFARNVATVIGNIAAGSGTGFMINFIGNATLNYNPNK